jgi:hypothetical protein
MPDESLPSPGPRRSRGWPRAAGLLGIALATSIVRPTVLIGVPFLALVLGLGARRVSVVLASALWMAFALSGNPGDGVWYVERGWALIAGGVFVAITLRRPGAAFSGRALGAVVGATAAAAAFLALRSDAWGSVQWAIRDRMSDGVGTAMEAWRLMRGGQALPPALVSAVYRTVEVQAAVFPALLGIASMASLGVAWWLYVRLSSGSDQGLGPLRDFRFNDHLVWLFIAGLVLVVIRWGDALAGVGANAVVFMGALYALRGAAVIMFLSGGLSLFGYVLVGLGLLFVPPLVLVGALVVGIGDTWLDVRNRTRSRAA